MDGPPLSDGGRATPADATTSTSAASGTGLATLGTAATPQQLPPRAAIGLKEEPARTLSATSATKSQKPTVQGCILDTPRRRHTRRQRAPRRSTQMRPLSRRVARPLLATPLKRLPRPIVHTLAMAMAGVKRHKPRVLPRRGRLACLKRPFALGREPRHAGTLATITLSRHKTPPKAQRVAQMAGPLRRVLGPPAIKRLLTLAAPRTRAAITRKGQTRRRA